MTTTVVLQCVSRKIELWIEIISNRYCNHHRSIQGDDTHSFTPTQMVFIILMNQYVGVCRCISNCVPSSYLLNGRGDIKFDFFIPASGNRLCEFMLFVEETNPFSQLQQINTSHRGNQNFSWYERITPSPAVLKKSKSKLKSSQNSRFIFHISKKENHKESWNSPRKSLQNANESGRLKKKPKKKKIKAFHQDSDTKRLYITSSLKKKNGGYVSF